MPDSGEAEVLRGQIPQRSPREEFHNALTHFFAFGLSLAGAIALLPLAMTESTPATTVACFIYMFSMMAVFLFSALSHAVSKPSRQEMFRKLDQAFIYLLIVASWTTFSVTFLPTAWWQGVLLLMWLIALFGFASKLIWGHRLNRVSIWIYVALGWAPVLGGLLVTPLIPRAVLVLILAGGVFYTGGTVFLANDRKASWFHPLWHLLVLAGAAAHYFAILWYVV